MKQIYIVISDDYRPKPIMAFQNLNDARKAASALYDKEENESLDSLIKSVPFMFDQPQKIDLADVDNLMQVVCETYASAVRDVMDIVKQAE